MHSAAANFMLCPKLIRFSVAFWKNILKLAHCVAGLRSIFVIQKVQTNMRKILMKLHALGHEYFPSMYSDGLGGNNFKGVLFSCCRLGLLLDPYLLLLRPLLHIE